MPLNPPLAAASSARALLLFSQPGSSAIASASRHIQSALLLVTTYGIATIGTLGEVSEAMQFVLAAYADSEQRV
jgi:hypothetical protein